MYATPARPANDRPVGITERRGIPFISRLVLSSPHDFLNPNFWELAWKLTRKGVARGAASCHDGEAFSMPAGRKRGRPLRKPFKTQKEKGWEGPGCRIRQRPTRLARPRVDAYIRVRPSLREIWLEEGMNQGSEPARRWDPERDL